MFLLLILKNRQYFNVFIRQIKISNLEDENAKTIYTILEDCERNGNNDESAFNSIENNSLRNMVFDALSGTDNSGFDVKAAVNDSIKAIKMRSLLERRGDIISLINSGDLEKMKSEESSGLLEAKIRLDREIEELRKSEDF